MYEYSGARTARKRDLLIHNRSKRELIYRDLQQRQIRPTTEANQTYMDVEIVGCTHDQTQQRALAYAHAWHRDGAMLHIPSI
jgi:hypothetical protein